ncbi:MAG: hypothetical protein LBD48_15250 [Treponema sp.]|nr:hypothetical protein [Treponema sp.]
MVFVTTGVVLLWFGYSLLAGQFSGFRLALRRRPRRRSRTGRASPGDPQVCPICSSRLNRGELVKTLAFPSITGGRDRLMHIRGCIYCLDGDIERNCPVCGASLRDNDILVARMFERPHRRPHVHVIGCSRCKRTGIR